MKLQFRQIESFVKAIPAHIRMVVIYGPDTGLVSERFTTIGKQIVGDLTDPFNVSVLTSDILAADPARLEDETFAQSLMGGKRLIKIDDATDKITPALKSYLLKPNDHALIILIAGELGPKSSLRALAEKAENAAALPCYLDSSEDVSNLVQQSLRADGYAIDHEACVLFSQAITGDRLQIRGEIDKLMTYMGDVKKISLIDVEACIGTGGLSTLDELSDAFMMDQHAAFLTSFRRVIADGTPVIYILRSLQQHVRRLHIVKAQIAAGKSEDMAMKGLHPPVFFKREKAFQWQLNSFSIKALEVRLNYLLQIEASVKISTLDDVLQSGQGLLRLMKAS